MRNLRYTVSLSLAALVFSVAAVKAEEATKFKMPDIKAQKEAETKLNASKKEMAGVTNAVRKDAEKKMKQTQEQAEALQKQQAKKTEELKKEAAKGSAQGQAMREEHSKKWWKFWGSEEPAPAK